MQVTLPATILFDSILGPKDYHHISEELFKHLAPILHDNALYRVSPPGFFTECNNDYIRVNYILWRTADWLTHYDVQMKRMRDSAANRASYHAIDHLRDAVTKAFAIHPLFKNLDTGPFVKMILDKKMTKFTMGHPFNLDLDLTAAWTAYEYEISLARESVRG